MFIKILFIVLLFTVMFNLFYALYHMIRNDGQAPKMSKYLGRRLIFSALIIFALVIALALGFITPQPTPH
jgi:hypothetical protein